MKGQGNLLNLQSGVKIVGAINDPDAVSEGWSVTARMPFADLVQQGHCKSPPRCTTRALHPLPHMLPRLQAHHKHHTEGVL